MRKSEKTAIFRVFTDLIKADDIIDIKEIDFLDELREKYGITKECEITAGSLTLAKALKTIATADKKTRHSLMNDFIRVAMSDDFCAKEEALFIDWTTAFIDNK